LRLKLRGSHSSSFQPKDHARLTTLNSRARNPTRAAKTVDRVEREQNQRRLEILAAGPWSEWQWDAGRQDY